MKALSAHQEVRAEADVGDMTEFLDTLKYNDAGLVAAIVQVTRCTMIACLRLRHILRYFLIWMSCAHGCNATQDIDTGEILMQAFSDRAAISETLQTGLATFYSRSRKVESKRLVL